MEMYEIKDGTIIYNDIVMKKSKEFEFENVEYVQFLNNQEHKYIVMKKISENLCIKIVDKELIKKIIDENFKKATDIIE